MPSYLIIRDEGPEKLREVIGVPHDSLVKAMAAAVTAAKLQKGQEVSWRDNAAYRAANIEREIQPVYFLFIGGQYTGLSITETIFQ